MHHRACAPTGWAGAQQCSCGTQRSRYRCPTRRATTCQPSVRMCSPGADAPPAFLESLALYVPAIESRAVHAALVPRELRACLHLGVPFVRRDEVDGLDVRAVGEHISTSRTNLQVSIGQQYGSRRGGQALRVASRRSVRRFGRLSWSERAITAIRGSWPKVSDVSSSPAAPHRGPDLGPHRRACRRRITGDAAPPRPGCTVLPRASR